LNKDTFKVGRDDTGRQFVYQFTDKMEKKPTGQALREMLQGGECMNYQVFIKILLAKISLLHIIYM
jgi:hypothetical protein